GLPADGGVLRTHPRRLPQPDRSTVRQPLRPRPGPAGRRRIRPGARSRKDVPGAPGGGVPGRRERGEPPVGLGVGAGPGRGDGRGGVGGGGVVAGGFWLAGGVVGPAARAGGIECAARLDFPAGIYRFAQVPVSTWETGDVFARAYVRWLEIQRSVAFLRDQLV